METQPNTRTLTPFVETLKVGDAVGHLNLALVPLRGEGHGQLDYLLAVEALAAGSLTVTEVSQGGTVPELLAHNEAARMVLLLDGEELVGAKQNRILNTSVLLAAQTKTRIPVSCVEAGRWRHSSETFSAGTHSPSKLRARKSRDVGRSLRETGRAMSDQGAVWEAVAENLHAVNASAPTMAMHDAVDQRRESLDGYLNALQYPVGSRGVCVLINAGFVALDLFDKPETLERVWPRLLTGYALDALAMLNRKDAPIERRGAAPILAGLGTLGCQPCPTVGIGEDWRFESTDFVGQALVAQGVCVHLSAFPNDNHRGSGEANRGQPIQPPSSRRRGRRGPADDIV